MKKIFILSVIYFLGTPGLLFAQTTVPVNFPMLSAQAKGDNYKTYHNEHQNFYISYPANIFVLKEPQSSHHYGGEQAFISKDGRANMFISGFYKADPLDTGWNGVPLKQLYTDALKQKGRNITYKALGKNWYVVSGMENGKVFYEKFILASDRKIEFIIRYPKSQEKIYDIVTAQVIKSIKY
jgi:hypothetical protein